jgi:F1F0 ATPase subunit 2
MSALELLLAALAGVALGLVYFGGLWWTVRRLQIWRQPHWALLASFVVRAGLVLPVFVLLALRGALPLVFALLGFLAARFALQARAAAAFRAGTARGAGTGGAP